MVVGCWLLVVGWFAGLFQPVVYQFSGYGELLRDGGQAVAVKPSTFCQFLLLQFYLARDVVGIESHHQSAGIRPGLGGEISQIGDFQSHFLMHFAPYSLLQGLAGLHEARYKTMEIAPEIASSHQQHLIHALVYEHYHGSGKLGPYFLSASGAALRDVCLQFHRSTAYAAEFRVHVPIEYLVAFAGFLI